LFISNEFSEQIKDKKRKKDIFSYNRSTVLIQQMIGLRIHVYNGLRFFTFVVSSDMIGHRLGEFAATRKHPIVKKNKQKTVKKTK